MGITTTIGYCCFHSLWFAQGEVVRAGGHLSFPEPEALRSQKPVEGKE